MNDLISRKALIEDVFNSFPQGGGTRIDFVKHIQFAPTIEAEPVKHGRWIRPTKIGHRTFDIPHCSACDGVPCGVDENTNYCPNCGAKMDLEEVE